MIVETDDGHVVTIRGGCVYIDGILEQDYCEESDTLTHIFDDDGLCRCGMEESHDK